jgi:uncharacterized protein (TIGR03000 family)
MRTRFFMFAGTLMVALAAWLLAPGVASAQRGGHGGGGHGGGGHGGGFHAGGFHAGGSHGGGHYAGHYGGYRGGWGGYRGGYYGYHHHGYGYPWYGFGLGLGYYPWYNGYYGSYYPSYLYSDYYAPSYSYDGYAADTYVPNYPSYTAPDYYGSSVAPNYYGSYTAPEGSSAGYYGAQSAAVDNTAHIVVRMPADAKLWFENDLTTQTGTERHFDSPPLTPGKEFSYNVRAQWREGNQDVTRSREVLVHAGDRVTVDFTQPVRGESTTTAPAGR